MVSGDGGENDDDDEEAKASDNAKIDNGANPLSLSKSCVADTPRGASNCWSRPTVLQRCATSECAWGNRLSPSHAVARARVRTLFSKITRVRRLSRVRSDDGRSLAPALHIRCGMIDAARPILRASFAD